MSDVIYANACPQLVDYDSYVDIRKALLSVDLKQRYLTQCYKQFLLQKQKKKLTLTSFQSKTTQLSRTLDTIPDVAIT